MCSKLESQSINNIFTGFRFHPKKSLFPPYYSNGDANNFEGNAMIWKFVLSTFVSSFIGRGWSFRLVPGLDMTGARNS